MCMYAFRTCDVFCAGMVSGLLLEKFCPDDGMCDDGSRPIIPPDQRFCDGVSLWGIIGLMTLVSPILILVTQVRPAL